MKIRANILFRKISPAHSLLGSILSTSIGFPDKDKINKVLESYKASNQLLIGAFYQRKLIAAIGLEFANSTAVIRHISVDELFKNQGVGKAMILHAIRKLALKEIFLETDEESVGFYNKIGFKCREFSGQNNLRYKCTFTL